jgi:predicted secreted protein
MPGIAGKAARVKISTVAGGGGVYNVMLGVKSVSATIDGATVDDSEMSIDWVQRLQGLKDGKYTIQVNRRPADATGQNACLSALINDTELWVQVLPDNGTTALIGFKQQVKVAKFSADAAVDGANTASIELEGTGAITLI